ncbi:MAG: hypothetical protein IKQ06_01760 [Bacilli bacterium]|nr:hypothetical protein [Bacilli bacterium]
MEQKSKTYIRPIVIVMIFVFITIGYAYLTSALNINGATLLKKPTWDVHFENVQVKDGSVTGEQVIDEPEIDSEQTTVSFHVNLKKPGDYYEFTVDAVNAGTIDAMINTITDFDLTTDQLKYLETSVTYEDGEEVQAKQQLLAGDTAVYKIRVEYKLDLDAEDLPSNPEQLDLEFSVEYVQKDDTAIRRRSEKALYNVLKKEAESGSGYALKYTGAHQDSMDTSLSTKEIYHWYANDENDAGIIKDKWNVIFANHCWQMFRTTDTGGVKLIYNGEAENGKCLTNRSNHVGYAATYIPETQELLDTYYYGTSYSYDSTSSLFSLAGDITTGTISEKKYTCLSSSSNGTCSTLYLIDTISSDSTYYVIPLKGNSNSHFYGSLNYNAFAQGEEYSTGYMYNVSNYERDQKSMTSYTKVFYDTTLSTSYYYSDSYDYNETEANKYTLSNPYLISSSSEYSSLVGKYTFKSTTSDSSSSSIYYIAGVSGSTMYYKELKYGHDLSYYNFTITYGDSYTSNGNGTYTINNASTIDIYNWYSNYSNFGNNKYFCKNASSGNRCSSLYYSTVVMATHYSYSSMSNTYKYASGFTYDSTTSKYTLNNDSVSIWKALDSDSLDSIGDHHYTCWNSSGTCSKIAYIYRFVNGDEYWYIELENGRSIDDFFNDSLYGDNINSKSSTIKIGIDAWYAKYMNSYNSFIEDTIFCNDRSFSSDSGWNPNGGNIRTSALLHGSSGLSCSKVTDRFSINNSKAQLTYPVGLITYNELNYLGYRNVWYNYGSFWIGTPADISGIFDATGGNRVVFGVGGSVNASGVRPVISLIPWIQYESGDGSMANPYVIDTD